jgi:hypothetical protein
MGGVQEGLRQRLGVKRALSTSAHSAGVNCPCLFRISGGPGFSSVGIDAALPDQLRQSALAGHGKTRTQLRNHRLLKKLLTYAGFLV